MKRLTVVLWMMGGVLSATCAVADGNAQAGAAKSAVCGACHGANGNSASPEFPSLAGLGADYIATQLQNFKSGKRVNPIMMPMAMALSTQDMEDLGAYFGSQVNTGLETDVTAAKAGEVIYRAGDKSRSIPACMACHGPSGYGNAPAKFPALRGQHSEYVVKQLTAYASGERTTGPNGIMPTIAKRLTPDDMKDIAFYVQGLH